jgi:hypothetical protein
MGMLVQFDSYGNRKLRATHNEASCGGWKTASAGFVPALPATLVAGALEVFCHTPSQTTSKGGTGMKTVHLIALGFTLASAIAGFAGQSPRQTDDILVFSTMTFVKHDQYPPETRMITLIQSSSGMVRADVDNVSILSTVDGLFLIDKNHRIAVRIPGAKMSDLFLSLTGVQRESKPRVVSSKVTGYVYHLGYRCRVVQQQLEEDGVRSQRTEWVARIGSNDIVLRRAETGSRTYFVQEAYRVTSGPAQKWLTIPSGFSIQECRSIPEALQKIAAHSD